MLSSKRKVGGGCGNRGATIRVQVTTIRFYEVWAQDPEDAGLAMAALMEAQTPVGVSCMQVESGTVMATSAPITVWEEIA